MANISLDEGKKIHKWFDDDGNGMIEPEEVAGKFKKKKSKKKSSKNEDDMGNENEDEEDKKETNELFSNWRGDLLENKKNKDSRINDKRVDNSGLIEINPKLEENIKNMGGEILDIREKENNNFTCIFENLHASELFFVTDSIIEDCLSDFFYDNMNEGYSINYLYEVINESIDNSLSLITESSDTAGQRKSKLLKKTKKIAKKLIRGTGYLLGAARRHSKNAYREFSAGYESGRKRKRYVSSDSSSSENSSGDSGSSRVTVNNTPSGSSRRTGSSRVTVNNTPSGSSRRTGSSRVTVNNTSSNSNSDSGSSSRSNVSNNIRRTVSSNMNSNLRKPNTYRYSNAGPGKRFDVVGNGTKNLPSQKELKKLPPSKENKKSEVKSKSNSPEPNTKPKRKPKAKTSTVKVSSRETNPKKKGNPSLDELLKDIKDEVQYDKKIHFYEWVSYVIENGIDISSVKISDLYEKYNILEKSVSIDQQRLFGSALSVKMGKTPRDSVSKEVLRIVDDMSEDEIVKYAKTSHKGLPKSKE